MRVVASDTCHTRIVDETFALPQIGDLIGDVIVFGVGRDQRLIVFVEPLTRSIGEGRSQMFNGVAMTLRTDLDLTFAFEATGKHNVFASSLLRIGSVVLHVLAPRPMAGFAGHAQDATLAVVLVESARYVLDPRAVTFDAARGELPSKIAAAIGIKVAGRPFFGRIKPSDWQFAHQTVVVPRDEDVVADTASSQNEVHSGAGDIVAARFIVGDLIETIVIA